MRTNTFEEPEAVKPQPYTGARLNGEGLELTLPRMSVVALDVW